MNDGLLPVKNKFLKNQLRQYNKKKRDVRDNYFKSREKSVGPRCVELNKIIFSISLDDIINIIVIVNHIILDSCLKYVVFLALSPPVPRSPSHKALLGY